MDLMIWQQVYMRLHCFKKDQLIIEYFSVSSLLIDSEEDFRDYLTLITIIKYQEVAGNLKKERDKH